MKTLEMHLRDPDLKDEPLPLREIHAVRMLIQDETNGMTPNERAKNAAEQAKKLVELYGLKLKRPERLLAETP